jgi:hypothetical protein
MFPFPFSFVAPTVSGLADIDNVYSMEFDGLDDYMLITNSPLDVLDTSGVISISFWYYISNTGTDMVFAQKTSAAFELYKTTDWYLSKSGNVSFSPSQPPVILNEWVHVVLTLPKGIGTANFYQNSVSGGQQLYTGASGNSITIGGFPFNIGRRANNTLFFDGKLDEIAIFDYALDADQVEEIYNATSTGKTADLSSMATPPVAWYRMGD